jgi:hypothetical protein
MVRSSSILVLAACSLCAASAVRSVPLSDVDITDEFWGPRLQVNRTVSIQHCFRQTEATGRFDNTRLIASPIPTRSFA